MKASGMEQARDPGAATNDQGSANGLPRRVTRSASQWFRRQCLRTQLLLSVNVIAGIGLIAFLYADYRHSAAAAIHTKVASLSDEARAIAVAVEPLQQLGLPAVQAHINAVCTAMDRTQSPGHMIEVRIGEDELHSHPSLHGERESDATVKSESRVTGTASMNAVSVAVSERTEGAIREAQREAVLRASIITASGALGTLLINLLLLRLVDVPIRRLTGYVREVGLGTFGKPLQAGGSAEIAYLAGEIGVMSGELARREDDRQRQLARARQLQRHLMSATGTRRRDGSAISFQPADEVAGDFAEIIDLEDGSVLICLADASGHGIAAAMGVAMIKALLLSLDLSAHSPAAVLNQMNARYLQASLPDDFVSMIVVRINAARDTATYASAGHETCYVRRCDGRVTDLQSTGTLLGMCEDAECEDAMVSLQQGDTIVLVSDGVSEAMNENGDLYGRARLVERLAAAASNTTGELVALICEDVQRHRQAARSVDDMTVLAFAIDSQK